MKKVLILAIVLSSLTSYSQAVLGDYHTITIVNPWVEQTTKYPADQFNELRDINKLIPDSLQKLHGFNQLAYSLKEGLTNGKFDVLDAQYHHLSKQQVELLLSRVDTQHIEDHVSHELIEVTQVIEFIFPYECTKIDVVFSLEYDVETQTMNYETREYIIYKARINNFGKVVGQPVLFVLKPKNS